MNLCLPHVLMQETRTADSPEKSFEGVGFTENTDIDLVGCPSNLILGLSPEEIEKTVESLQETLENEMDIFI